MAESTKSSRGWTLGTCTRWSAAVNRSSPSLAITTGIALCAR